MSNQNDGRVTGHRESPPADLYQPIYQTTREDDEPLAVAIPMAVAAVSGREQTEFPPLYNAVDPDQLNALIDSLRDTEAGAVRFSYAGYLIEIEGTGELTLWTETHH